VRLMHFEADPHFHRRLLDFCSVPLRSLSDSFNTIDLQQDRRSDHAMDPAVQGQGCSPEEMGDADGTVPGGIVIE
jgi:hypothetical protein